MTETVFTQVEADAPLPMGYEPLVLPRNLWRALLAIGAGLAILFVSMLSFMANGLSHWLDRIEGSVGEAMFTKAVQLEEAGLYDEAEEAYRAALMARFKGPWNRTDALKRLGTLLWWRKGPGKALPFLLECYYRPSSPITLYEPLTDSLTRLNRAEEALKVAAYWRQIAQNRGDVRQEALSHHYEGLARRVLGDEDAALAHFIEAEKLSPGGVSAYEAGVRLYDLGQWGQAEPFLDAFVRAHTDSPNRVQYARRLLELIRAKSVAVSGQS